MMTHGPKSQLELAAKRLGEFMNEHHATFDEMQSVTGIIKRNLQMVLEQRTIASMYADEVVLQLGSQCRDLAVAKLKEIRGFKPQKEQPARAETETEASPMKTNPDMSAEIDAATKAAMKRLNTSKSGLCRALGKGPSFLANAYTNSADGGMKEETANKIIADLNALTRSDLIPTAKKSQSKAAKSNPAPEADTTSAPMSETAGEIDDTSETHQPEPGCVSESVENDSQDQLMNAHDGQQHSSSDDADYEVKAFTINVTADLQRLIESDARAKAKARLMIEDALGIDLDELVELKPQLELLAVCKRNNIECELIVGPCVVGR